jgi:hypothetical protein
MVLLAVGTAVLAGPSAARAGDDDYVLKTASIVFDTPKGDNKDHDTSVTVEVSAKKGKKETAIAAKKNFANNDEFPDPSTKTFDIPVTEKIKYSDMNLLTTVITIQPNGNDRWIFNYTLTLTFEDEKAKKSKTATQMFKGIILDQKNKVRTTQTWIRFPEYAQKHKLTSAKIVFTTPAKNDNKDKDTALDVELTYPLDEKNVVRAASLFKFAGDREFKDDGSSHEFTLTKNTPMTLEQFASSSFRITTNPRGNDRWIFDFNLTLKFEGEGDPIEVPIVRSGIILDQDNRNFRIDP